MKLISFIHISWTKQEINILKEALKYISDESNRSPKALFVKWKNSRSQELRPSYHNKEEWKNLCSQELIRSYHNKEEKILMDEIEKSGKWADISKLLEPKDRYQVFSRFQDQNVENGQRK